ncbi:MAG: peptide chain release factor N(5)-glutamine methyltransferase, partial [Gammaproteobacteria bacterium]|nr:peptide chain release factor N(5)-glutamine methyltransferase [Gammaproteobacteria bacterium]
VTATDLSADALAVAEENARQLALPNIEFLHGSWTEPLEGKEFDVVVSNPPYVASDDPHLAMLRHEPVGALDAGDDGLDAIRALASSVADILRPGGHLLLEHGARQAESVTEILRQTGWTDIQTINDMEGRPRVTAASKPGDVD